MSELFFQTVLALVRARKNRTPEDTSQDALFEIYIRGAFSKLSEMGIRISESDPADTIMLVDYAVWRYNTRDSGEAVPLWLKTDLSQRWLTDPFRAAPGGESL